MTNETLFITQIGVAITLVVSIFVLYKLLVSQKDSVIELLRERLAAESAKIEELRTQTPDALVNSLNSRIEIMNEELNRLKRDGTSTDEVIAIKERELSSVREQILKLFQLIQDSDLVCPSCSSPLLQRVSETVYGYVGGKEVDADIEFREYECGAAFEGGTQKISCHFNKVEDKGGQLSLASLSVSSPELWTK